MSWKLEFIVIPMILLIGCNNFSNQEIIDLRNRRIKRIPKSVFENPEIKKELYIGIDEFTIYPPMSIVPMGEIQLSTLNERLSELILLERLTITSTQIKKLPDSMSNLKKLKYLNLSFNEKLKLENEVDKIVLLKSLDTLVLYGVELDLDSRSRLKSEISGIQIIDEISLTRILENK